jgi:uncharacterized protein YbjT (DUF2867 family)
MYDRIDKAERASQPEARARQGAWNSSERDPMYVVAGVTGNTGKVVAETLLAHGKPVRAVVRSEAKGAEWRRRGAEVVVAELGDALALARALAGAAGAYVLLPSQYESVDARADGEKRTRAIVQAVESSGVEHVVFLSAVGAQHASGTGPVGPLHDAEVALSNVKAAVTSVRAAYFMENWGASLSALAQGLLPTFLALGRAIPMVATADAGTVSAKALLEGGKGYSVIELAGPREYTPEDVAIALSRNTGKPMTAVQGPEDAMVSALMGAGLNRHWAELYQLTHALNKGHMAWEGRPARFVRGSTEIDAVLSKLVRG